MKRILQGARSTQWHHAGMLRWPPCVKTAGLYAFLHGLRKCQIVEDDEKYRMLNGCVSSVYAFADEKDCVIKSMLHPA